ncbi:peptide deformylase, mitochondrial-like [Ostrinia furnacalis]|uniref:peptide deformylase, mitochondrial-like n=1 Tax=Ostrinia furnacalis TaxID=93504 RepID=UPI00103F102F|nr:peptide deformylase, mitochondrial-like [Ostrinia furnacalis]
MGAMRKVLNWYARLSPSRGKTSPPYEHVVQIGDPRLRKVSDPVPVDKIKSEEVQKVINKLRLVLHKYGSVGMSAPQIGVNMRMFVMRHTAKQISAVPPEIAKSKGMSVVPFTVFINPKIKVVDYQKVIYMEGCESVQGYSAEVPRYREVEVTGYDENGESATRVFKLWPARIAQHEMDHLDGKMFTDLMERRTLTCACWEEVNLSKGKVVIPFNPE